ncbi:MAG: hypothetical protein QW334_03025 [Thermofilum sp.]
MIGYVYHLIHVKVPHRYVPKLFVTGIPKGVSPSDLKILLEENGYDFGEFGIPWANHYIGLGLKDAPPEVKGAWLKGTVEKVRYQDLLIDWEKVEEEAG